VLEVTPRVRVPLRELEIHFVRSSGPGGQNVNKVNTKAVLRWAVEQNESVPVDVRARLRERYRRRFTKDGDLVIQSQRFRDQGRNVADCLAKLRELLASVATPPRVRRATRPSRAAAARRLEQKRRQGQKKRERKKLDD